MESKDLDKIKKYYGEDFAHYCRVFSTILDTATEENPTPLFNLLSTYFYPNKSLLEDLVEQNKLEQFKKYIFGDTKGKDSSIYRGFRFGKIQYCF